MFVIGANIRTKFVITKLCAIYFIHISTKFYIMKKDWSKCSEEELQEMPFMRAQMCRIMKELNISGAEFSKLCKRSPAYFTSVTGEVDSGTIRNLIESLPNFNVVWFITGKGNMFLDGPVSTLQTEKSVISLKTDCPINIYNELFQKYSETLVKCAKLEYENKNLQEVIESLKVK